MLPFVQLHPRAKSFEPGDSLLHYLHHHLPIADHARTRFPLAGMHATLRCDQCHSRASAGDFRGAQRDCFQCHRNDYFAAPKHASASFPRVGKALMPLLVPVAAMHAAGARRGQRALAVYLLAVGVVSAVGLLVWVANGAGFESRARGLASERKPR